MVTISRAVRLNRELGAGFNRETIQVDRAGAALAGVAPDMRPGETGDLANEVHEEQSRLNFVGL